MNSICTKFLQLLKINTNIGNAFLVRKYCIAPNLYRLQDPAPIFFDSDVQKLLKFLTRIDLNKVYRKRKREEKYLETPVYKFMTDEQVQEAMKNAIDKANRLLQMPPVIKVREKIENTLSKDSALQGYDSSKYIFTDITYGVKDSERIILLRKPDGDLIEADWDVRHRMNQIYFPMNGRRISIPLMFEEQYLKSLLERNEHEFILDRACIQFEPNDPFYQKVTSITYENIQDNYKFDLLRSTRHFGPLVFYLVWFKSIDNLVLELINTSNIEESIALIQLFNKVHNIKSTVSENIKLLEIYIKENSSKGPQLELALQACQEKKKQENELKEGIQRAHGK